MCLIDTVNIKLNCSKYQLELWKDSRILTEMDSAVEFKNLPELVGYIRSKLTGITPKDALQRLDNIIGGGVIIRYEIIQEGDKSKTSEPKSKYSHVEGCKLSRVLLSTYKRTANLSEELYRQLNGIVFQYPSWNVLSVPCPILNHRASFSTVSENISEYDIYPVIDGTVVTLYYYDGNWRLSSSNGYDVTSMRWLSSKTYMDAVQELITYYPAFSFGRLNPSCSYTIGFRHHSFHPMTSDPQKIWFIQSCNTALLNNLSVSNVDISKIIGQSSATVSSILSKSNTKPVLIINTKEDIGLPIQAPLEIKGDAKEIIATLRSHNENALVEFSKSLSGDFLEAPHYGYFLRPKTSRADLCDIILESTLLNLVRKALYNFPKKREFGQSELTPENRIEYAKLRSYLSGSIKYQFLTLFPQFHEDYVRFDTLFKKIAERIIYIIRHPEDKKIIEQRIEVVAQKFASIIKEQKINTSGPEGLSIVLDILNDRRHLEFYFTFLIVGK